MENEKRFSIFVDHSLFSFPAELKLSAIPASLFRLFHYREHRWI
jgi:hypothetical protein